MDIKNLSDEQRAMIAGKTPDEIVELAQQEGIELTDEQLEQVAGGWGGNRTCPECGSESVVWDEYLSMFICRSCGNEF